MQYNNLTAQETKSGLIAKIPFENHHGTIILKVIINSYEQPLRMVFDTGADGMAVDKDLAEKMGLVITRENNASVVGGNQKIQVSDKNKIRLEGLELDNVGIAVFPVRTDAKTDGIIGNAILRRYITVINFDENMLYLYGFGDFKYPENSEVTAFSFPQGVIHLKGDLTVGNGPTANGEFVFDTGAAYSLIVFRPFVKTNRLLVNEFVPLAQSSTISLGMASPTFTGYSKNFKITAGPDLGDQVVTLMGGNSMNSNWNPAVDGSLGIRIISRFNIIINMAKNEMVFSPNKLHSLPHDFVVKNRLMGWNNTGELILLEHIGNTSSNNKNKHIRSIDHRNSSELVNQKYLIKRLQEKSKTANLEIIFEDGTKEII